MSFLSLMVRKTSRVTYANVESESLRATIPKEIKEYLELKTGDVIEWESYTEKGKKYAKIRKLE